MKVKSNTGRKPLADKAKLLRIYPRESVILALGYEKAREIAIEAVNKAYNKIILK